MSKRGQQEMTREMGRKSAECGILDTKCRKYINEQEEQFSNTFDWSVLEI